MNSKKALIIGAGPAGLTTAYELLTRTDIKPVIFELSEDIGGISKTVNYKGNRIDIGGHRFFSKSDRVMAWWKQMLPILPLDESETTKIDIAYQGKSRQVDIEDDAPAENRDLVFLIRKRLSRILYRRKLYSYPISLNTETIMNLGVFRIGRIGLSYIRSRLFPIRNERSLEDFLINRFGLELYGTFFKDYTEKVWGVPCHEIPAEWGAQRIKGLSISKALGHAVKSLFRKDTSIDQKGTETSLIEQFLYPKFGPGQMWEEVAKRVIELGGEIHMGCQAVGFTTENGDVSEVTVKNSHSGEVECHQGDYFFSTMPVKELIHAFKNSAPPAVHEVASGLVYRDFITVGLLLKRLRVDNNTALNTVNNLIPDNWIYVQESDVKLGRLQIFNNWSPYMVKDPDTVWIGLEYFCNEGDELWQKSDETFTQFAIRELDKIGVIDSADVLDHTLIRMPKTYPAYFGTYDRFDTIKEFVDLHENLFLIGRNGMHKYNNADHSMLTAMVAVDNIIEGITDKSNVWAVNTEMDYHEEKELEEKTA